MPEYQQLESAAFTSDQGDDLAGYRRLLGRLGLPSLQAWAERLTIDRVTWELEHPSSERPVHTLSVFGRPVHVEPYVYLVNRDVDPLLVRPILVTNLAIWAEDIWYGDHGRYHGHTVPLLTWWIAATHDELQADVFLTDELTDGASHDALCGAEPDFDLALLGLSTPVERYQRPGLRRAPRGESLWLWRPEVWGLDLEAQLLLA